MTPMRLVYLGLAVWGAVHPMYYFMSYLSANAWSLGALIDAWYVNDSTTGLTWDLTIAAITLTIWILHETISRRNWLGLLAIPVTYGIGISAGLPLYLLLRARQSQ